MELIRSPTERCPDCTYLLLGTFKAYIVMGRSLKLWETKISLQLYLKIQFIPHRKQAIYDGDRLTFICPVANTCTAGFHIHRTHVLSVEHISAFCMNLRTN